MNIGQTAHLPGSHPPNYSREHSMAPRSYELGSRDSSYLQTVKRAERVGFEPTRRLNTAYAISNRAPSANSDTSPGRRTGVYQKGQLLLHLSAALGRVAGVYPVLLTALVLEDVLVTHGHQLTDDPRRGVSIVVRAVSHHLGSLIWQEVGDHAHVLEPDRTW